MGDSTIEWTGPTHNFWTGCHKVSPGCRSCYAETMTRRLGSVWGRSTDFSVVTRAPDERFYAPHGWKKPALVFTCSMSDFFIKEADPWRADAWNVIRHTPHLTWQILTKRPERIGRNLTAMCFKCGGARWDDSERHEGHEPQWWPWPNVWLGTSVETQQFADERIPHLLRVPAAVRFLSVEPLLGPVDLSAFLPTPLCEDGLPLLDWVIVGGESGARARPFDLAWARSIRDQCRAAGTAFFFKQGGASNRCPHSAKGGCLDCIPEDLRVRDFPRAAGPSPAR